VESRNDWTGDRSIIGRSKVRVVVTRFSVWLRSASAAIGIFMPTKKQPHSTAGLSAETFRLHRSLAGEAGSFPPSTEGSSSGTSRAGVPLNSSHRNPGLDQ
jgi:hypothetical protein